ncbi:MAG: hypothetical protein GYA24_22110 [Candidatus Lokiarchaeota archaeon]|nr:hypothetical protein [Candidatus Lokiarchaeota archaeon]
MENPSATAESAEVQPDTSTLAGEAPVKGGFTSEAAPGFARPAQAKPASAGFSTESYTSPGLSSSPATPARASGFNTLDSDAGTSQPQEKKSYMQIMKEKQQYQSQQFQDTVNAEQQVTKPAAKPAQKPAAPPAGGPVVKPAGGPVVKPAGGPVVKPAGGPPVKPVGMKPPATPDVTPAGTQIAELPELEALPDLPPIEETPVEAVQPVTSPTEQLPEQATVEPAVPAPVASPPTKPAGTPVMKPAGGPPVKPVGMKPPVKPAGTPVVKPAGTPVMKPAGMPPMKPAGTPVVKPTGGPPVKPAGMKPPATSSFQSVEPPAPASSAFQSVEPPAPRYVPPAVENESITPPPVPAPATGPASGGRLQHLLGALDNVLSGLSWSQEKKDMLKQELVNLPESEQIAFLEQLGVEIPPEHAAPVAPAPVAPTMHAPVAPVPVVSMPVVPAPVIPAPGMPAQGMPSMASPPMKPVVGMQPTVSPPAGMPGPGVVKPAGMKPPVKPVVAPGGTGIVKPPVKPVVAPGGTGIVKPPVKPAGAIPMKPVVDLPSSFPPAPVIPTTSPAAPASNAAFGLFNSIDQQIEQTVAGDFDLDTFLDTGLELNLPGTAETTEPGSGVPVPKPPVEAPSPVALEETEEEAKSVAKPAIKLSQISTKVEKKSEADLKREEERQKAQAATESSLVYMRLLAFEKACSIPKNFKVSDLSKMLKDLDPQVLIDFITAVDNDFIIKYDDDKKQVVVSEISGPEMEILTRQFEKWLRFGRL